MFAPDLLSGNVILVTGGERLQGSQFNFLAKLMPREELREHFRTLRPDKPASRTS